MRWLINWWRGLRKCPREVAEPTAGRVAAANARESAERALAEARRQGPEVSEMAGRLRRVRGDDFARLMTDAMRGT